MKSAFVGNVVRISNPANDGTNLFNARALHVALRVVQVPIAAIPCCRVPVRLREFVRGTCAASLHCRTDQFRHFLFCAHKSSSGILIGAKVVVHFFLSLVFRRKRNDREHKDVGLRPNFGAYGLPLPSLACLVLNNLRMNLHDSFRFVVERTS